ncbi:MAG: biosynthetic-type acetolactate synthase large subunit, partial [Pseudomonadota bacterium]
MSMSGAALLMRSLEAMGTEIIFGYPGGAIMPVYDALVDSSIKHILVRHEQGASLAADGYARATGKVGVCMATSGPGATNLVTGIANAHLDSIPMIAITGQVAAEFMGTDAFQEVDIFGITLPIVKHSYIVKNVDDIPRIVQEAFHIAMEGRPGPVLIDLPKNVAIAESDVALAFDVIPEPAPIQPEQDLIDRAIAMINEAKKPILYIGGGIGMADAVEDFRRMAKQVGIPIVSTLKGLGTVPGDDDQFIGMMGMHGNQAANLSVQESDLLICLGARFDDRATGKLDEFAPHASVIHVDTDPSEISKLRQADVGIVGDLSSVFAALEKAKPDIRPWVDATAGYRAEHAWRYDAPGEGVYAPAMLKRLTELNPNLLVACDVGQHQMWVAQHCRFERPDRHLTSGGLGTMGYGLPAAIGAKLGNPELDVLC